MTAAAAIVSLLGTLAFSRAMARLSPARLLPAAVAASALLFLGEWGLAAPLPRAAAVAVYLHHAILGAMLLSGFWSLVSETFDPYRARHSMGAIGAGASLGGIAGALFTWRAAAVASVPAMLAVLAAMSAVSLLSLLPLVRAAGRRVEAPLDAGARSGLELIRQTPYLRGLAALVALCAFVEAVLDYLLGAAATSAVGRGPALMSFFALFHAGTGVLALVLQTLLFSPLLARAGLTVTLASLPAFTALAAGFAWAVPRLASLVVLRGGHAVLRNSAFRSGYELLYVPLPADRKRPTKVIIDVGCDRIGTVAGSAAVLATAALFHASPRVLLALASMAAVATIALAVRFRRGYVGVLAESLRAEAPELDPTALVEPATLLTMASIHRLPRAVGASAADPRRRDPVMEAIADVRSGDAARIEAALAREELDARLLPHVVPLLADDALVPIASAALRRAGTRCTGQLVDALLDPALEAVVRRRVARVLKGVPTQRAADGLLIALEDDRFDVRYRAAQALVRIRGENPGLAMAPERVLALARQEAAHAGRSPRHLEHVFTVLSLVLDRRPLEIARRALQGGDASLRGTALEYLDNVLPPAVRDRIWPSLGQGGRPARSGRSADDMANDLLRSTGPTSPRP
jgi:ATP:ADP antiporter, AAA family